MELSSFDYKNCHVSITYDEYSDSPAEWGNFTIVQFRDRDRTNYGDLDDYLTENGKLLPSVRAKLKAGKIFAFDYSSYSNTDNGYYRYPTGEVPTGELDSRDVNGFIIFEDEYMQNAISYDDLQNMARQDLEMYTQWANGEVYGVTITDEHGEDVDMTFGIYGIEDAEQSAKDVIDNYQPPRTSIYAPRAGSLHV